MGSKGVITKDPAARKNEVLALKTVQPQKDVHGNFVWDANAVGLNGLLAVEKVILRQRIEIFEELTGIETRNKYEVLNEQGIILLKFEEEAGDDCHRICCGPGRRFVIWVYDNQNKPVLKIWREFRCCADACCWSACCDACQQQIVIESPEGKVLGAMQHRASCWKPYYSVMDATDNSDMYYVNGPCCAPCVCPNIVADFQITEASSGQNIGEITKFWDGCLRMCCTVADSFAVMFPPDMDVNHKALILCCAVLIDFQYYEDKGDNSGGN